MPKLTPKQREWFANNPDRTYPVICKLCPTPVKWNAAIGQYRTYCSTTCYHSDKEFTTNVRKNTILNRYGVPHTTQLMEVQTKTKKTNLERYGHENIAHGIKKEKVTATMLRKYGVENASRNSEIKDRKKRTTMKHHNVENPFQCDKIRTRIKQIMVLRHGAEYTTQSLTLLDKIKQTNLARYGVEWNVVSKSSKEKQIQTCLDRYGVEFSSQSHMTATLPLIKDYSWLFEQYIVLNKTATQIAYELGIGDTAVGRYLKTHEIAIKHTYGQSHKCLKWIENIASVEDIHIQHAGNGGEYGIPSTPYHADGYCAETNTIYEFHGDYWHGNPKIYDSKYTNKVVNIPMGELYQKTINRENKIKELGYNLVVMWESDFI